MLDNGAEQASEFLVKVQIKYFLEANDAPPTRRFLKAVEEYRAALELARGIEIKKRSVTEKAKEELRAANARMQGMDAKRVLS